MSIPPGTKLGLWLVALLLCGLGLFVGARLMGWPTQGGGVKPQENVWDIDDLLNHIERHGETVVSRNDVGDDYSFVKLTRLSFQVKVHPSAKAADADAEANLIWRNFSFKCFQQDHVRILENLLR